MQDWVIERQIMNLGYAGSRQKCGRDKAGGLIAYFCLDFFVYFLHPRKKVKA